MGGIVKCRNLGGSKNFWKKTVWSFTMKAQTINNLDRIAIERQ